LTFSPRFRIILSSNRGFLFVLGCPYQYTKGRRALEESDTGAVDAAVPSEFAEDAVGIGPDTGATERVPGAAQAPWGIGQEISYGMENVLKYLARIDIHKERCPALSSTDGVVCQNLTNCRLARVFWSEDENSWWLRQCSILLRDGRALDFT
jgi:hypothetical protein